MNNRHRRSHRSRRPARLLWSLLGLAMLSAIAGGGWVLLERVPELRQLAVPGLDADRPLADIPANTWVKLSQPWRLDWRRQAHSGMAFDGARRRLILFGSDTHGLNWDNRVHLFDLATRKWSSPLPEQGRETYRADAEGHAVAGPEDSPCPVAMHTYDSLAYDPKQDALVVLGRPEHNPAARQIAGARSHPAWIFDLAGNRWRIADSTSSAPALFGGALAYDRKRDTLVAYKHGIWELGPDRRVWQKASRESHHDIHHNMEYDARRGFMVMFGNYTNTNRVWIYRPNAIPGQPGAWEARTPTGRAPPPSQTLPVAFDEDHGLFLLAVDQRGPATAKADHAETYVYDPDRNRYMQLPLGRLPALGMNFMMAYSPADKVFLLVTGDWKLPPTVWALRLNPDLLRD